jgi:hypothetical protein
MIDTKDVLTLDAFPIIKRGRPSTGNALSPAQRMRAKRSRDELSIREANFTGDYSQISTTALLESFSQNVLLKCEKLAKAIAKELLKRSKLD